MGRNFYDYDFDNAVKPCGTNENPAKPSGKCVDYSKENCPWFPMCDLPEKCPWEKPTRPKKYKIKKFIK